MRKYAALLFACALASCSVILHGGDAASGSGPDAPAASAPAPENVSGLYHGVRLPSGPELSALQANCEICHGAELYTTQRLSKTVWDSEVTKMMKFGSPLPKSEKGRLVAYLATYLGTTVPRNPVFPTATAPPITYSGPQ